MRTRLIVQLALLVAMSVVLTRFASVMLSFAGIPAIRLSFGEIPILIAGLLFGPAAGAVTGILADVTGILLVPPPAIFPGFTLSAALTGMLPPIISRLLRQRPEAPSFGKTLAVIAITDVVVSLFLNTLWLSILYERGMLAILPGRLIARAVLVPVYAAAVLAILRAYRAAGLGALREATR